MSELQKFWAARRAMLDAWNAALPHMTWDEAREEENGTGSAMAQLRNMRTDGGRMAVMDTVAPWEERNIGLTGPRIYPGISLRETPRNVMAEQILLGGLLANNKALERVIDVLRPDHFSEPTNGRIYAEISRLVVAGRIADAVTLKQVFENSGVLSDVGGTAYLSSLMAAMVGLDILEYGRVIVETSIRRKLIELGETLVSDAFGTGESEKTADLIAQAAISQIEAAANCSGNASRLISLAGAMDAAIEAMERAKNGMSGGISSGFSCIDSRLGGLEPGQVYVIAGRPGMGKSAIGHQIALNAARNGVGVLELSLEMSAQQLGRRTLAIAAQVPIMAIKRGRPSVADAERIVVARKELADLPLSIDDTAGQTASMIAAKARSYRRKHGLGLVMIDHLNLMRPEDQDAKHGGTWAVERASGAVLQIAKDCQCPVILLAQLNRGVEGREDKRPGLSDLRQAGAIEQDAYAVGFVYRAEYYMAVEPERRDDEKPAKFDERLAAWHHRKAGLKGTAELIWAKVRDGEPGSDGLLFNGPTASFSEGSSYV